MTNDKCPFCGTERNHHSSVGNKFLCGTWPPEQSDHCKLIVANRELEEKYLRLVARLRDGKIMELEERHKRLVEAGKKFLDLDASTTDEDADDIIEEFRKAVEG